MAQSAEKLPVPLPPRKSSSGALQAFMDAGTRERLRSILEDGTPPNTRRAYGADLRYFWAWAMAIGWAEEPQYPVPQEIIVRFIVDHVEGMDSETDEWLVSAGYKSKHGPHSMNTVERRVSTLASTHKAKGLANPCEGHLVSQLLSKARKAAARRGKRVTKKTAVVKDHLDQMLETCASGRLLDVRDRALLLFAWSSGGRRRSEVASATMENLERVGDEFNYTLGITKTDQEGKGTVVPIAGRAARALAEWLEQSGIEAGPIFRSLDRHGNMREISKASGLCDRTVARIVKNRAKMIGLDPRTFAGHSLRSGFLTEAGIQGKNLFDAMTLSTHKTVQVAMGYHQAGAGLRNQAARLAD